MDAKIVQLLGSSTEADVYAGLEAARTADEDAFFENLRATFKGVYPKIVLFELLDRKLSRLSHVSDLDLYVGLIQNLGLSDRIELLANAKKFIIIEYFPELYGDVKMVNAWEDSLHFDSLKAAIAYVEDRKIKNFESLGVVFLNPDDLKEDDGMNTADIQSMWVVDKILQLSFADFIDYTELEQNNTLSYINQIRDNVFLSNSFNKDDDSAQVMNPFYKSNFIEEGFIFLRSEFSIEGGDLEFSLNIYVK